MTANEIEEAERRLVVILGMHRSGTSALTRALNMAGGGLPANLLPPAPDNPEGFFESADLVALHDEMLQSLGSGWHDTGIIEPTKLATAVEQFAPRLAGSLAAQWQGQTSLLIKDPRICRLFPLWQRVAAEAALPLEVVLIIRNPREVAESLARRDGIPIARAQLLWLRYMLEAEKATRGLPRHILCYDDLLLQGEDLVLPLAAALGIMHRQPDSSTREAIGRYLRPELRHHRRAAAETGGATGVAALVRDAFGWCLAAAANEHAEPAILDSIASTLADPDELLVMLTDATEATEAQQRREQAAEQDLRQHLANIEASYQQQLRDQRAAFATITRSTSWRLTAPLRAGVDGLRATRRMPARVAEFMRMQRVAGHSPPRAVLNGLARVGHLGERRLRVMLGDESAAPASDYAVWLQRQMAADAARTDEVAQIIDGFSRKPVFSIVMPTYRTPEQWLVKAIESVRLQSYPHWELCICDDASPGDEVRDILDRHAAEDSRIKVVYRTENGHIARATNDAMALMTGDFMCLMDHDDEIAPHALFEFAQVLNAEPDVEFIYSDEDKISVDGNHYEPFFKPDWSPLLLESCMYTAHFACYRNDIVRRVGGFRPECNGAQDYDFALRFTEHVTQVRHIPKILYHWRAIPGSTAQSMDNKSYVIDAAVRALTERCRRSGRPARVGPGPYAGAFVCRRAIVGSPRVSIVIPSAGRNAVIRGKDLDLLVNCVQGIYRRSTYRNFEVVVVDNGDLRPSTLAALAPFQVRFVTYASPTFNVAAKMNLGAQHAQGDYLLFLNDDIDPIAPDWLEAMLAVAQRPNVGMVGAKLRFEDGTLQHVGVAMCNGWPDHIRRGFPPDDPGYLFSSVTTREVTAVTGACALLPTDLFQRVGGFNEDFAVNYNDIDLCMRVRATGASIVQSNEAELYHFESRSRERTVDERELALWATLWGEACMVDRYYSPIFNPQPPTYEPDFPKRGHLLTGLAAA